MVRHASLPLRLLLLLLAAAATATPRPQLLPLDDDPDIDARRSYLPPQGYLPPQDDVALGAAAAPQQAVAPPPGAGEQCGHAFHSFLCGRGRRPGAEAAPQAAFQQPSRLRPEPSPTPPPLLPNPQFQATFLQPSRIRPPTPNALPSLHLNCTSHATLEVRPPPAPQPTRDRDPAPSAPSFRLLLTPQRFTLPNDINRQTKEHNCTSETTLTVASPANSPPPYSRQPQLPLERSPYPPYVEQTRPPPPHDSTNCSSQTTERPTTTPPPRRVFADPSPQPSATFESARITPLLNHPPGCTCGADHSAGSSVDATFINPERVAPPQQFRTTTSRATTTTTTTTTRPTTERPSPRPLEPLAAAPEPVVVAPPKSPSWSEEDSCSHAFHSFLCRKPQAASSNRRKALDGQPVQGDSSFISAASLPAPKKATPPPSVPRRQPQTRPPTTTTTTRRAPTPTAAPPSRRPPSTQPPGTTAKPTTVSSGPVIEPQAAQDAPVVAVPRPNGDDGHHQHHHHHEGKDLCSDPFHSFLCQKVDTSKRRRVYGRLPQAPLPAGSSPDRARVEGPAFVGDSTFVKSAAVPPPGNFVSSASPTPTARPTFTSSISPFTTPPPQQRRRPTPAIRDEYSELPRYFTAPRRPATTTESETVRTTPIPPCHTEGGAIHQPTIATFSRLFPQLPSYRSEQAASNVLATVSDPGPQNIPYQKPRAPAVYPSSRSDTSYSTGTVAYTETTVAPVFFNRITAAQTKSAPPAVLDPKPQGRSRPAASNSQPVTPCVKLGGKCVDVAATNPQLSAFASSPSTPVQAERISTPRPPSPTARTTTLPADNDVQPAAAQNDDARVLPDNTAEHGHDHHDHHHHHHSGNICDDPFHSFLCEPTKPRRRFDGRPQTSGNRRRPPTTAGGSPGLGGPPLEGAGSFLSAATLVPPTPTKPRSRGRYSLDKPQGASDEALPAAAQQQEVVGYLYPQPATPLRYPGELVRTNSFPQEGDLPATAKSFLAERVNNIRSFEKNRSSGGLSVKRDTLHAASVSHDVTGDRQLSETSLEQSSASDSQPTRWSWAQTAA